MLRLALALFLGLSGSFVYAGDADQPEEIGCGDELLGAVHHFKRLKINTTPRSIHLFRINKEDQKLFATVPPVAWALAGAEDALVKMGTDVEIDIPPIKYRTELRHNIRVQIPRPAHGTAIDTTVELFVQMPYSVEKEAGKPAGNAFQVLTLFIIRMAERPATENSFEAISKEAEAHRESIAALEDDAETPDTVKKFIPKWLGLLKETPNATEEQRRNRLLMGILQTRWEHDYLINQLKGN